MKSGKLHCVPPIWFMVLLVVSLTDHLAATLRAAEPGRILVGTTVFITRCAKSICAGIVLNMNSV